MGVVTKYGLSVAGGAAVFGGGGGGGGGERGGRSVEYRFIVHMVKWQANG